MSLKQSLLTQIETNNNLHPQESVTQIKEKGFPTKKWEAWRYFDMERLLSKAVSLSDNQQADPSLFTHKKGLNLDTSQITIVNGQLANVKDLEQGLLVESTNKKETLGTHAFHWLNQVLGPETIKITINQGIRLIKPIQVLIISTSPKQISFPNIHVNLEKDSEATCFVDYNTPSSDASVLCSQVKINLEPGARLNYIDLKDNQAGETKLDQMDVTLGEKAHCEVVQFILGGESTRNEINVHCMGEDCQFYAHGLGLVRQKESCFQVLEVNHNVPNCYSSQTFKNILSDEATAEYNGLVFVKKDAQKTLSNQLNRNLLLGEHAIAYSRPQLRIYADDVKCIHGSTSGQLEAAEILYLMSRGLSREHAKSLLVYGFAEEIVETVSNKAIRHFIKDRVAAQLKTIQSKV